MLGILLWTEMLPTIWEKLKKIGLILYVKYLSFFKVH